MEDDSGQLLEGIHASSNLVTLSDRLNQLPCDTASEFLSGVRKIADELDNRQLIVSEELCYMDEILPEKLEALRIQKRDLLKLREQVVTLRDGYMTQAREIVDVLREKAPEILEAIESVSAKKAQLRVLECEGEGDDVIAECQTALALKEILRLSSAYAAALSHADKLLELDTTHRANFITKLDAITKEIMEFVNDEIDRVLSSINFPFEDSVDNRSLKIEVSRLTQLLVLLFDMEESANKQSGLRKVTDRLFEPITQRFKFHFYGDRKTNDINKPEWYLTQVLCWIQTTLPFFELVLSGVATTKGVTISAGQCFLQRVCDLALVKTRQLLNNEEVKCDSSVFAHLLDECIAFDEQCIGSVHIDSDIRLMSLFCEKDVLSHWIEIENDSCISHLDDILSGIDRWKNRFRELEEVDNYLVCECADSFVALLHSLQHRAHLLPDEVAQRRFVDLQLLLIDDFLQRLAQISRQAESPFSEPFPHIMNSVWYICDLMGSWSDTCVLAGVISSGGSRAVFEGSQLMYKHVWESMSENIVLSLRIQITDHARQYQRQRWCQETRAISDRDISSLFCPLLMKIRSTFANVGSLISKASVSTLFKKMTFAVAKVLKDEVIDCTTFNAEGASQMLHDVEKGLIPVLNNIYKRYDASCVAAEFNEMMRVVVSSLRLLSTSWAVATLLREELENAPEEVCVDKLWSLNIIDVTGEMAERLFNQRSDLVETKVAASTVSQLIVGYAESVDGVYKATGSVTLVRSGNRAILVDCGDPWNGQDIKTKLVSHELDPEQITDVVVTHGHLDHCANMAMFQEARIFMGSDHAKGGEYGTLEDGCYSICDDVKIVEMKGHTDCDLVAIVQNTDRGCVVIAGDIFESEMDEESWRPLSRFPEEQDMSRQHIRSLADWIVPGHGPEFRNPRSNRQ